MRRKHLAIPMLDSKGQVGTDPARTIDHKTERNIVPSPDWYYAEHFKNRDGFDYVVFLRVSEK